jgi:hypothetical protein
MFSQHLEKERGIIEKQFVDLHIPCVAHFPLGITISMRVENATGFPRGCRIVVFYQRLKTPRLDRLLPLL